MISSRFKQVPPHPIGAGQVDLFVPAVAEVEHAGVLQVAIDDRADLDILGNAFHAGPQHADPADVQDDLHAGLAGAIQGLADLGVLQRIHLGHDQPRPVGRRDLDLAIDEVEELALQARGGNRQLRPADGLRKAGEQVEEGGHVVGDVAVGRHQAEVAVELRRAVVVVARGQVDVALDAIALAADDQEGLGVRLVAGDAVNHVGPQVFQAAGPLDVAGLVEAGPQLHQHGHFLAALRRPAQGADDGRIAAGAIERLLDGQHVGIVGRLLDQPHHRLERLVRMEQEHVVIGEGLEQVVAAQQIARRLRRPLDVLQLLEAGPVRQFHQGRAVERGVHLVDLLGLQLHQLVEPGADAADRRRAKPAGGPAAAAAA